MPLGNSFAAAEKMKGTESVPWHGPAQGGTALTLSWHRVPPPNSTICDSDTLGLDQILYSKHHFIAELRQESANNLQKLVESFEDVLCTFSSAQVPS